MLSFGSRSCVRTPSAAQGTPSRNRRLLDCGGYDVIVAAKPEAPCVFDDCRVVDAARTGNSDNETEIDLCGFSTSGDIQLECSSRSQRKGSFMIDSILSERVGGMSTSDESVPHNADQNSPSSVNSCSRIKRFAGSSIDSSSGSERSCSSPGMIVENFNSLPHSAQHATPNQFPVSDQLQRHYQPTQYLNKHHLIPSNDDACTNESFLPSDTLQSSWRYQFQQRQNPDETASLAESPAEHRGLIQHHRHRGKRIRTIFTADQLHRLEAQFERQQYMVGSERYYLASSLRLTEAQVKVWFQNRRIKWRKQSVERQQAKMAVVSYNKLVNDDDFNNNSDSNDVTTGNTDAVSGHECYLTNDSKQTTEW